jgi:hypothetical protein
MFPRTTGASAIGLLEVPELPRSILAGASSFLHWCLCLCDLPYSLIESSGEQGGFFKIPLKLLYFDSFAHRTVPPEGNG